MGFHRRLWEGVQMDWLELSLVIGTEGMSNWKIPASTIFREDLESIFLAEENKFFQKQQLTPTPELLPPGIRPGPAPPSRRVGTRLEGSGQSPHGGQGHLLLSNTKMGCLFLHL